MLEDTDIGVDIGESCRGVRGRHHSHARRRAHARGRRARRPGRRCPRRATVLVIAHRGASAELPENTLPAFERAIEIGADYVEFDVWNGLEVTHAPPRARRLVSDAGRGDRALPRTHRPDGRAESGHAATPSNGRCACSRTTTSSSRSSGGRSRRRAACGRGCAPSSTSASACRSAAPRARGRSGFRTQRVTRRGIAAAQALGLETTVYTVNDVARMLRAARPRRDRRLHGRPAAALAALRWATSLRRCPAALRRRPA